MRADITEGPLLQRLTRRVLSYPPARSSETRASGASGCLGLDRARQLPLTSLWCWILTTARNTSVAGRSAPALMVVLTIVVFLVRGAPHRDRNCTVRSCFYFILNIRDPGELTGLQPSQNLFFRTGLYFVGLVFLTGDARDSTWDLHHVQHTMFTLSYLRLFELQKILGTVLKTVLSL